LQVGALIGAGLSRGLVEKGWSKEAASFVNLKLFGGIALSWVATIPFSMGLTALIYLVLEAVLL
jgi:phosphate/sulfate permease